MPLITLSNGRRLNVRINHVVQKGMKTFTSAIVYEAKDVLGFGLAKLHPMDRFVRKSGTRVALTKALASAGLSRPERAEVWARVWNKKQKEAV